MNTFNEYLPLANFLLNFLFIPLLLILQKISNNITALQSDVKNDHDKIVRIETNIDRRQENFRIENDRRTHHD